MTDSKTSVAQLIVLSGPSGVGKTTIAQAVIDSDPLLQRSISHTSRWRRAAEVNGLHYHFVSEEEFLRMRNNKEFLETASIFGNHYGTSKAAVELSLNQGIDTILVIDWQGARNVRRLFSNSFSIFVLPPSLGELRNRLIERQEDPPDVIDFRMEQARVDMTHYVEYDYVIVNDLFDTTVEQIHTIVDSVRDRQSIAIGPSSQEIQSILQS